MLFLLSLTNPYLLQELGRRENTTQRRSQGLSLNPSPTPLDVQPLPGRIEPGPKGRRAGDRKSAGKKSKMAKSGRGTADSRSSVATLKSHEVDVDEKMDTATPEDIEAGSRREEAPEAITARNSKCIQRSTAAVCADALIFGLGAFDQFFIRFRGLLSVCSISMIPSQYLVANQLVS
jgi:hypothetical protein